jgi:hypothetical protein
MTVPQSCHTTRLRNAGVNTAAGAKAIGFCPTARAAAGQLPSSANVVAENPEACSSLATTVLQNRITAPATRLTPDPITSNLGDFRADDGRDVCTSAIEARLSYWAEALVPSIPG